MNKASSATNSENVFLLWTIPVKEYMLIKTTATAKKDKSPLAVAVYTIYQFKLISSCKQNSSC